MHFNALQTYTFGFLWHLLLTVIMGWIYKPISIYFLFIYLFYFSLCVSSIITIIRDVQHPWFNTCLWSAAFRFCVLIISVRFISLRIDCFCGPIGLRAEMRKLLPACKVHLKKQHSQTSSVVMTCIKKCF